MTDDKEFLDWVEASTETGDAAPLPLTTGDKVDRMTVVTKSGKKFVLNGVVCTKGLDQMLPMEGDGIETEEVAMVTVELDETDHGEKS